MKNENSLPWTDDSASFGVGEEGDGVIRMLTGDQYWPELFNEVQQLGAA